jgi:hypothetical protein
MGDGLIALVLSHNLRRSGMQVTTFHPFLSGMQDWFPNLPIRPFPRVEELSAFDSFFIFYEKSEWMQAILAHCEKHFPEQTKVLNPIATTRGNYPYWEVGKFDGRRPLAENLRIFCQKGLDLPCCTKENGIVIPKDLKKHPTRVVIHPTSSRRGKDWPEEKFLALAQKLTAQGFEPVFILSGEERKSWDLARIQAPFFENLDALVHYVAESGWMIGNDSGIGHLASCLGLATLTICRSYPIAQFWRPAWAEGRIVAPYMWIPNLKGLRLRDKHWKKWVSVSRVLRAFLELNNRPLS